jgi:hypothetical protein
MPSALVAPPDCFICLQAFVRSAIMVLPGQARTYNRGCDRMKGITVTPANTRIAPAKSRPPVRLPRRSETVIRGGFALPAPLEWLSTVYEGAC